MLILPQIKELQRADLKDLNGNGSIVLESGSYRNISGVFSDIKDNNTTVYCSNYNATINVTTSTSEYNSSFNVDNNINFIGGITLNNLSYSITNSVCSIITTIPINIGSKIYVNFNTGINSSFNNEYTISNNTLNDNIRFNINNSNTSGLCNVIYYPTTILNLIKGNNGAPGQGGGGQGGQRGGGGGG
jgi:hypothetical protein